MAEHDTLEPAPAPEDSAPAETQDSATAALQRERDELQDRLLRTAAEFDNYRKRVERERREQADRTVTDLLRALVAVVDDFERALAADVDSGSAGETSAHRKGIEIIRAKLLDLLGRQGVRPIEALGTDFDPTIHEAVSHEESPGRREGEIIGELSRGYMLGDRLLRPAMVKVAKA
jgi:molecular chaperone GrpE